MSGVSHPTLTAGVGNIEATWQRLYGPREDGRAAWHQAPYLVSLRLGGSFDPSCRSILDAWMPQARAVVDDFGTLYVVERWA